MGDFKELLIGAGALALGLLIVNYLTTPKPPRWPSDYGFAGFTSLASFTGYDGYNYSGDYRQW